MQSVEKHLQVLNKATYNLLLARDKFLASDFGNEIQEEMRLAQEAYEKAKMELDESIKIALK